MIRRLPPSVEDLGLLVARLLIGTVMFAYGWNKFVTTGLSATAAGFAEAGVPLPTASAAFSATVELVGGALLILGAATALVGVLMVLLMIGAAVTTQQYYAVLAEENGFALSGAVLASALLLACFGAGRFSVDHALSRRSRAQQSAESPSRP